jgi:hypothetical protein
VSIDPNEDRRHSNTDRDSRLCLSETNRMRCHIGVETSPNRTVRADGIGVDPRMKKKLLLEGEIKQPLRGFSVLLPYRDYMSPSVAIRIYSSV